MKRWILKANTTGLDGLVMEEVPVPEPGADEVRVKVHAVSLNYRDQIILNGVYGTTPTEDIIPISDGAGVIDAVGTDVKQWSVGDPVVGVYFDGWYDGPPKTGMGFGLGSAGQNGMLAEYVILKADRVTRFPVDYSYQQAATLPCAALTAWTALYGEHPAGSDSKVLVLGTGGVALFALLFAHADGGQVVVTSSQDAKLERARALGASDAINYRTQPQWGQVVFERTGGVDKVINSAGGAALNESFMAVAAGGEIAIMGLFEHGDEAPIMPILMSKGASIRGTSVGGLKAFEDMVNRIEETGIEPPIGHTFGFDDVKDAYQMQLSGDLFGKIVIEVA